MHLLYLDASGTARNSHEKHFVLGGVAVFERGIYHIIQELDEVVRKYANADDLDLELHGNPILGGRHGWGHIEPKDRSAVLKDALAVCAGQSRNQLRLFGVVIEKAALVSDVAGEIVDPVEYAFEQIADRFNKFLQRKYNETSEPQRGLLIMDESSYEQRFQGLATDFRKNGGKWGNMRNLAEVPMFADSRASRLIQLADLVSLALWRRYEHDDLRFITPITSSFDQSGGIYHGLRHHTNDHQSCQCLACESRRNPIPRTRQL